MVDELINLFKKNDLERKMFLVYMKGTILPIIVGLLLMYTIDTFIGFLVYVVLLLLFELIGINLFIIRETPNISKFFRLNKTAIKNNIALFSQYKKDVNREIVERFLQENNIVSDDKLLFLLESIKVYKKPKLQRDWLNLLVTAIFTIEVAIVEGNIINSSKFALFLYTVALIILFYMAYQFVKWICDEFKSISSIDRIERILSDVYLSRK